MQKRTDSGKIFPVGNGCFCDNYYWTQTLNETTIYVEVKRGIKGKDVTCDLHNQFIKLVVEDKTIMEGNLDDTIHVDESIWTIEGSTDIDELACIIIHLEKRKKTWWKSVIHGHNEIDTTKVDSTQKIGM